MGKMLAILSIALIFAISSSNCKTTVTLYEHMNFKGYTSELKNLEDTGYYYLTFFNDRTSSFRFDSGSCAEFYDNTPPRTDEPWFWAEHDTSFVGSAWNDRISSVRRCGSESRTYRCPSGTFVKKVEWDSSNSLKGGIKLHCFEPSEVKTPSKILHTHPGSNFNGQQVSCAGVRGLQMDYDSRREVDYGLSPVCEASTSSYPLICKGDKNNEALSGITVQVEKHTNNIKNTKVYCSEVDNIEEVCSAADEWQILFSCDGREAVAPYTCTHTKTIGTGEKTTLSQGESNEKNFYAEFGMETGASGFGLSVNFQTTLGMSETTTFNWETSQESTWSKEVQFEIKVEIPPGCLTTIKEVVGTCSFFAVRPNQIARIDQCNNKTLITNVMIPIGMRSGQVFVVPIPDALINPKAGHREEDPGYGTVALYEEIDNNNDDSEHHKLIVYETENNNSTKHQSNNHGSTEVVRPLLETLRSVFKSPPAEGSQRRHRTSNSIRA